MSRTPRQPDLVISATGRRDTKIVGSLRLASAAGIAGSIVAIGHVFNGGGGSWAVAALALGLFAGVCAWGELAWGGHAARAEERRIRADLLQRQFELASRAGSKDADAGPGRLMQLMTDNTERVTEYRQIYFGATIAAVLIPFMVLAWIAITIDAVVGLVVMALVPLIPFGIRGFMLLFRKTSANSRQQRGILANRYLDAIRNMTTIRLLGAGERVEADLREQGEKNRGMIMRLLAGNQIVIIVMDGLFALVLICLTAWLTVVRANSGHLDMGEVLTILMLTVLLLEPLLQVAGFFYIGMGGMASQKALNAHLAAVGVPEATTEADLAEGFEPNPGLAVQLSGVSFDHGRGTVLSDIDLEVEHGERIALIGRSGAGKSTLMGLLAGTLSPQTGAVVVDGRIADPQDPKAVRQASATVSQSTWMFTGTIADNLRIAREDASDAEMWEALRLAHVADEIERMPHGLDTHLGEGAALVSGGQAQRISLARALLSGRRILLLDEPTSQVDIESEARIIDAISALPRDWTIVMITHRHSLLRIADRTFELEAGHLTAKETAHV